MHRLKGNHVGGKDAGRAVGLQEEGGARWASHWRSTWNMGRAAGGARAWCCGALKAGVVDRTDTGGSIGSGWMLESGWVLVWWRTDRGTTVACATSTGAMVGAVSHTALCVRRNGANPRGGKNGQEATDHPMEGFLRWAGGAAEWAAVVVQEEAGKLEGWAPAALVNGVSGPHPPGSEWHPGWHDTH